MFTVRRTIVRAWNLVNTLGSKRELGDEIGIKIVEDVSQITMIVFCTAFAIFSN